MKLQALLTIIGLVLIAVITSWILSTSLMLSNGPTSGISPASASTPTPTPDQQPTKFIKSFELLPVSLSDLSQYEGLWQSELWRSEDRTDYYFQYEFNIFTSSILITLRQHEMDSVFSIAVWRGFTEIDSTATQLQFRLLNFSGGFGWKTVQSDGERLVLEYEMPGTEDASQNIRQVLTFVHEYRFDSITYVAQDEGWHEVWRSTWLRVIP